MTDRCPACGPTTTERHPRISEVLRCTNCKEHIRAALEGETP